MSKGPVLGQFSSALLSAAAVPNHRKRVGGMWEEIGKLQFDFMLSRGLMPHHVLVDVGCGCLRGGRFFIPYLQPGNYLGLDRDAGLIRAGLLHEVSEALIRDRQPEFVVSDTFEFHRFSKRPTHALAQSLFTHLAECDIIRCLRSLRAVVDRSAELYATYVPPYASPEGLREFWPAEAFTGNYRNPPRSSNDPFIYHPAELRDLADRCGWRWQDLGPWNHPRGQHMGLFVAR